MKTTRGIFRQQRIREYEALYGAGSAGARAGATAISAEAEGERGVVLAERVSGEGALPLSGNLAVLSLERMCRHVLVCGATGSGKTETLLRLAWAVAKRSEAPVFYLDGKGDRENAKRFVALMADAGRQTRVFPNEPLDGWRGEAHEIRGRLMEMVAYAREGPAAWYRDVAKAVVGLACEHPRGAPRSSEELLERLDLEELRRAHPRARALGSLKAGQVDQVRLRYEAVLGEMRGALDGGWSWEETSAAYVLLDTLRLREETAGLARFVFEDFTQYYTGRKPRSRFCVMVVDEFSALASTPGMAARIEQARNFRTALILAPQALAGMGGVEERERIVASVETVVCHRVNTPEDVVGLAGTRKKTEYSTRFSREGSTGEGTAVRREQRKIDANKVLALPPGEAFVINQGRAMHARILRAPQLSTSLPWSEALSREAPRGTVASREADAGVSPPAEAPPGAVPPAQSGGTEDVRAGTQMGLPAKGQSKEGDEACRSDEISPWVRQVSTY